MSGLKTKWETFWPLRDFVSDAQDCQVCWRCLHQSFPAMQGSSAWRLIQLLICFNNHSGQPRLLSLGPSTSCLRAGRDNGHLGREDGQNEPGLSSTLQSNCSEYVKENRWWSLSKGLHRLSQTLIRVHNYLNTYMNKKSPYSCYEESSEHQASLAPRAAAEVDCLPLVEQYHFTTLR